MDVAEGATTVASVLSEKLTEGRILEGGLVEGRAAEGMLIVGKLVNGRLIESRLMDGRLSEFKPTETIGTLIGAIVATVTATYWTLTETSWGELVVNPAETVDVLPPLVLACNIDSIGVVRLDG